MDTVLLQVSNYKYCFVMKHGLSSVCVLLSILMPLCVTAQDTVSIPHNGKASKVLDRLTVGGYGEATYKHNFYSDNVFRYTFADRYKDAKGHGQVDLPHAVIMLGYDFGKGWSFGTEIEFEHGGVEAAVEMETEETGEYEKELERGGEVALEQFWIQKSFNQYANLRAGHIVVPVGATNNAHLPTQFYGVFRPEGENTILPCTWHETGISFWGKTKHWRYEVQLLPALNSTMFSVGRWANQASASAYEFRPANRLAFATRVDYTIPHWRFSLSGYVGNTFNNDIVTNNADKYKEVNGTVAIGAFDFKCEYGGFLMRGNADYGYLSEAGTISSINRRLSNSSGSPYPHTEVGKTAMAAGLEAGYDIFHTTKLNKMKLIPFVRADYYDSYNPPDTFNDYKWTERVCFSGGINYAPLPQIVVKAEGGIRMLHQQYNNEPWFALGITWAAMFNRR